MLPLVRSCLVLSAILVPLARSQEAKPAVVPEVQKLHALLGNWKGSGSAALAPQAPQTKWSARGTFREAFDGQFVREDFEIRFEGNPVPMVMRAYLGYDRERARFVQVRANNAGKVDLTDLTVLADGSMLALAILEQGGVPYAERSSWKVEGDTLHLTLDLFLQSGPAVPVVSGAFERTDAVYEAEFAVGAFGDAHPQEPLTKLARLVGVYDLAATVVMAPGAPPLQVRGVEDFRTGFGGLVLVGTSTGSAEGYPGTYAAEVFWGFDPRTGSITSVYVTNSGEVGGSESRFAGDGRTLVSVHSGLRRGVPLSQRFVMHVDEKGVMTEVVGHTLLGDAPPLEGYRGKYVRR